MPRPKRRLLHCLIAATVALLPLSPSRAGDDQPGAPFLGELPDVGPEHDPEDTPARHVVRVLDAKSGFPIAGAQVSWTPERIEPKLARAYVLAATATDARGFAFFDAELWTEGAHWVADAPGFAPAHHYGRLPPSILWLTPGVSVTTRLLNAFGQPVIGAKVQWFRGCGHAPTLRHAVSDAKGHVTIPSVDPSLGELWIEAERVAGGYYSLMDAAAYGEGVHNLVLSYGRTARGRVVGLSGEPIAGVVVRSLQCFRGPATTTNVEGTFTLHGVEPGESLVFAHPATLLTPRVGAPYLEGEDLSWREGVPFTVTLTPTRIVSPPRNCPVQVHIDLPADQTLGIDFVHEETGLVVETGASKGEPATEELFAGRWRVVPSAERAEFTFDETIIDAVPNKPATVHLVARALPRLTVYGLPRQWQQLRFAAFHSEVSHNRNGGVAWSPAISERGPVGVAITSRDNSPVQVFAAKYVGNEPRSVDIEMPQPTTIQLLPKSVSYRNVRLVAETTGVKLHLHVTERDDVLRTYARGAAKLILSDGDTQQVISLRLPDAPTTLTIHLATIPKEPIVTEAQITILKADGSHALEAVVHENSDDATVRWTYREPRGANIRSLLRVERDGFATLTHFVVDARPVTLRWGRASLELHTVTAEDDDPIETTLWIRGVAYAVPESGRTLHGLPAGVHEALVSIRNPNYAYEGRRIPITLTAGEVTKITLRLPDSE